MYKKLKTTHPDSAEFDALKINLCTYNKILKRNIKMAKSAYYQVSFSKYKNDIKGTWSVIKGGRGGREGREGGEGGRDDCYTYSNRYVH